MLIENCNTVFIAFFVLCLNSKCESGGEPGTSDKLPETGAVLAKL